MAYRYSRRKSILSGMLFLSSSLFCVEIEEEPTNLIGCTDQNNVSYMLEVGEYRFRTVWPGYKVKLYPPSGAQAERGFICVDPFKGPKNPYKAFFIGNDSCKQLSIFSPLPVPPVDQDETVSYVVIEDYEDQPLDDPNDD